MYGLLPVESSIADLEDILVEVPSGAGELLGLAEYFKAQREGHNRRGFLPPEPVIYVTAWTTEISFTLGRRREYVLDLDTRSDFNLDPSTPVDHKAAVGRPGRWPSSAGRCGDRRRQRGNSALSPWCWTRLDEIRSVELVRWRRGGRKSILWRMERGVRTSPWDRHFVRRRLRIL